MTVAPPTVALLVRLITAMDFDTGPTIWMPPSVPTGHNAPATFFDGQLASANFLTVSGFVTVAERPGRHADNRHDGLWSGRVPAAVVRHGSRREHG